MAATQVKLLNIDKNLSTSDLDNMKFLCGDLIGHAHLEKVSRGIRLFSELKKTVSDKQHAGQTYSWQHALEELLYKIGRIDMLKVLDTNKETIIERLKTKELRFLDPFTVLLFELHEQIIPSEFEELKQSYCQSFWSEAEALDEPREMFQLLETKGAIGRSPELFGRLEEMIGMLDSEIDLQKMIRMYKEEQGIPSHAPCSTTGPLTESEEPLSGPAILYPPQRPTLVPPIIQPTARDPPQPGKDPQEGRVSARPSPQESRQFVRQSPQEVGASSQQGLQERGGSMRPRQRAEQQPPSLQGAYTNIASLSSQEEANRAHAGPDDENALPRYKITSRPRGFCIIVNNERFNGGNLNDRPGTNVDRDSLDDLFKELHFKTEIYNNLTAKQLRTKMKIYASADHSRYDCLVVAILTHGYHGGIYGSDGEKVELGDITKMFKPLSCKTLANKPKIFVIQACQGKDTQPCVSLSMEPDAPLPSIPSTTTTPQRGEKKVTLPNEGDFLIAYASIPGFVSYRSKTAGSWFIKTLVNQIHKLHKKEDLLSILTEVNRKISEPTANGKFKQSPAPQHTLCKKIYFD